MPHLVFTPEDHALVERVVREGRESLKGLLIRPLEGIDLTQLVLEEDIETYLGYWEERLRDEVAGFMAYVALMKMGKVAGDPIDLALGEPTEPGVPYLGVVEILELDERETDAQELARKRISGAFVNRPGMRWDAFSWVSNALNDECRRIVEEELAPKLRDSIRAERGPAKGSRPSQGRILRIPLPIASGLWPRHGHRRGLP
jgi:hypothetical protein